MKKFNQFREDSLLEVLKASDPTGKWISDFVHSDNPKFAGKSKKERIQMALGASYASKRNEEVVEEGYGDGREYGGAYVNGRSDDARMTERLTRQAKAAAKKAGKTFNTSAEYRLWHMKQQSKKRNVAEGHYEDADDYLSKANDADAKGDKLTYHHHMADYHDSLSQWHEDKGRSASADKHAEKADFHSDKYTELARGVKEEIEPIEELNKDTVISYDIRAHKDQDKQFAIIDKAIRTNDPKTANKASHKFSKRSAGLDRAETRLNKEDTEVAEARMSAAQRLWNAEKKQRAKSDASLARTPSSIPKPEEKK